MIYFIIAIAGGLLLVQWINSLPRLLAGRAQDRAARKYQARRAELDRTLMYHPVYGTHTFGALSAKGWSDWQIQNTWRRVPVVVG
jgi:hypothetical protein